MPFQGFTVEELAFECRGRFSFADILANRRSAAFFAPYEVIVVPHLRQDRSRFE